MEPICIRPSQGLLKPLLKAVVLSAPFWALGAFMLSVSSTSSKEHGSHVVVMLSLICLYIGLRATVREIYMGIPIIYRDKRLYLANRIALTKSAPSHVLVKFDAHLIWLTYIVSSKEQTLIARNSLLSNDKQAICELAEKLAVPIMTQEVFWEKPKKARYPNGQSKSSEK